MVKVCTWNVNGIRSRDNLEEAFRSIASDVICIQETRVSKELIEEKLAFINDNYESCFAIPKKSIGFKGRSGCATYYLETARPYNVEYGFLDRDRCSDEWINLIEGTGHSLKLGEIYDLDSEGRLLITHHDIKISKEVIGEDDDGLRKLYIFNVYFPHLDHTRDDRASFKDKFNRLIEEKAHFYLKDSKSHVLIACDLNIKHKQIDTYEQEEDFDKNLYRIWLSNFLGKNTEPDQRYMVDTYRKLYPTNMFDYTCWPATVNPTRRSNFGHRIDLIMVDNELAKYTKDVRHLIEILGSDHCPVVIELSNIEFIPSKSHPPDALRLWPKFKKRQTRLSNFFQVQTKKREHNVRVDTCRDSNSPEIIYSPPKKQKQSCSSITQSDSSQAHFKSAQQIIISEKNGNSNKPLSGYEKIMQRKSIPKPPKPVTCKEHGLICDAKFNSKKDSKFKGKYYVSCPNPNCKFFRWLPPAN